MIKIINNDGFVAYIDPSEVSAYGIEAPSPKRLWIIVHDKEYTTNTDVDKQLTHIRDIMKDFNNNKRIKGITQ